MALSNDLLSQFAKAATGDKKVETETTVYGTVVEYDGKYHVRLDGSDRLTPMTSEVTAEPGERVAIRIKNHTASITGNVTTPATRVGKVEEIDGETRVYIDTVEGRMLVFDEGHFNRLVAVEGDFVNLRAETGEFHDLVTENLEAKQAVIEELRSKMITTDGLDAAFANIDFAKIDKAVFDEFYASSGIIQFVTSEDQTVTGHLVGVTISGDLIEGNTIAADKLVVKGEDGIYYKLNVTDGGITTEEYEKLDNEGKEALQSGLHGSNIIAKTLTADRVDVTDLVAFDATIGGIEIEDGSIHSYAKDSVDNGVEGFYLDKEGQVNIGGNSNYLRYFKDENGQYKLEIKASAIRLGSTGETVEDAINKHSSTTGRNLLRDTGTEDIVNHVVTLPSDKYIEVYGNKRLHDNILWVMGELDNSYIFYTNNSMPDYLEPDTEYVCSFDIECEEDITDLTVGISNAQGDKVQADAVRFESTCIGWELTHVECKLITKSRIPSGTSLAEQGVLIYLGSAMNTTIGIKNLKLERGTVGTSWIPAYEDYASYTDLGGYTTKEEFENLEIGAYNLIQNSDFSNGTSLWTIVGVDAEIITDETHGTCLEVVSNANGDINNRVYPSTDNFVHETDPNGNSRQYTLSFYAKTPVDNSAVLMAQAANDPDISRSFHLRSFWQRFTFAYSAGSGDISFWLQKAGQTAHITKIKIEHGNKATDWTYSAKEWASADSLDRLEKNTNSKFDETDGRIKLAEDALIDINDTIRMLVTDKDGTSLMTQTENGWTFSTSELQTSVDKLGELLSELAEDAEDFTASIKALEQAIDDHGDTLEYVTITEFEDEPCIALGESDSDFKLLITNTRIMFMHGSALLTYINTKGLVTENIEVKSDFRQGNFVWAVRANGNYGLMWKEVID